MTDEAAKPPHILAALNAVMKDVTAVGKDGFNQKQQYQFRGIDGVINAVGPAFREHGVIPTFKVVSIARREYESKNKAQMMETLVEVDYTFTSMADGTSITCYSVPGEASDSSDKGASKAMSVAYRVALIQALAIPTNQPDPDEETHERAVPTGPAQAPKEEKDDMFARMQAISDVDHRRKVKREFVANFGDLGTLPAADVDAASSWILNHEDVPAKPDKVVQPIDARLDGSDALNEPF